MDKQFHPTLYNRCNHLSMLGWKLNHVSKTGHWNGSYGRMRFERFWCIACSLEWRHIGVVASQISDKSTVSATVCSGLGQKNIYSSEVACPVVRWGASSPVNSPHERSVIRIFFCNGIIILSMSADRHTINHAGKTCLNQPEVGRIIINSANSRFYSDPVSTNYGTIPGIIQ